ncbi:MAG: hypothetical protein A2Y15_06250 [Clostridiales bacterium GWF2_36_10]|nr:MAG: hypothetical protein A2Y15_06250 [Clostridiales bacterium GWF2_36_10]HAN21882.1 hypothetical protein [Clostridiales bacterium]
MKYVKIPGQVYDLVKLFDYHFNKSTLNKIIENPEEYEQNYLNVLNGDQINDDLYSFFYSTDGTGNFITQMIFANNQNDFLSDNLFGTIIKKLKQTDMFEELFNYYLNLVNIESKNGKTLSPEQVYYVLKEAAIPDKIKLQLVHFSMNRNYYTDLLLNEMESKFTLVEKYFQKSKNKVEYTQRLIETDNADKDILTVLGIVPESGETIYCSVSAIDDKMAVVYSDGKNRCLVIGYGTIDKLQELLGSRSFDMFLVSKALADILRISIVNMVKDRGEMNTTEIANAFGKGLTAVFYHLNMLAEAHILNTRSRGRTVLYSVNNELFNNFSVFVKEFAVNRGARL